MNFTVSVQIQADDPDDAAQLVAQTWTLNTGAVVLSIIGAPEYTEGLPAQVDPQGRIALPAPGEQPAPPPNNG